MKTATKAIYSVYVIELSKRVYSEDRRFRQANPQFNGMLECLYVGMTSKQPEERFRQHRCGQLSKKGYNLAARIVKKYGMYLRPSLTAGLGLMTKTQALRMEAALAEKLKRQRYAVWYN